MARCIICSYLPEHAWLLYCAEAIIYHSLVNAKLYPSVSAQRASPLHTDACRFHSQAGAANMLHTAVAAAGTGCRNACNETAGPFGPGHKVSVLSEGSSWVRCGHSVTKQRSTCTVHVRWEHIHDLAEHANPSGWNIKVSQDLRALCRVFCAGSGEYQGVPGPTRSVQGVLCRVWRISRCPRTYALCAGCFVQGLANIKVSQDLRALCRVFCAGSGEVHPTSVTTRPGHVPGNMKKAGDKNAAMAILIVTVQSRLHPKPQKSRGT